MDIYLEKVFNIRKKSFTINNLHEQHLKDIEVLILFLNSTDPQKSPRKPISIQIGGQEPSAKDFRNMLNDSMRSPSLLVGGLFSVCLVQGQSS